ncbi:MAG: hypothetical protein ACREBF_00930 [Candidatus Micrarchaeales archaeon]
MNFFHRSSQNNKVAELHPTKTLPVPLSASRVEREKMDAIVLYQNDKNLMFEIASGKNPEYIHIDYYGKASQALKNEPAMLVKLFEANTHPIVRNNVIIMLNDAQKLSSLKKFVSAETTEYLRIEAKLADLQNKAVARINFYKEEAKNNAPNWQEMEKVIGEISVYTADPDQKFKWLNQLVDATLKMDATSKNVLLLNIETRLEMSTDFYKQKRPY